MYLNLRPLKTRTLLCIAGSIMLMLAACNSDGSNDTASAASSEDAASASMYALSTGDDTVTDEVYVAVEGDQARIYQRGSSANAVFCLGTFQLEKEAGSLAIVLSQESRLQARECLSQSLDKVSVKVDGSSTQVEVAVTEIANADSRLEAIRLFLGSELADEMDVEDALEAFEHDASLQAVLDEILYLKQAFIADANASGDPSAGLLLAKARLSVQLMRLLGNQTVLKVFYEKEILGSLLSDMDAADREIALYYACAAKILRQESTGLDELDEIDEISDELEELEALSVKAAVLEGRYLSFITSIGFENEDDTVDVNVSSLWNTTLWEGILGVFVEVDSDQYDINVAVCQPLDRLVRHCYMAGDAARAMRTIQWLDRLAQSTDDGRIVLEREHGGWTCPDGNITLLPVNDGTLTDWRTWEQWADEIDERI